MENEPPLSAADTYSPTSGAVGERALKDSPFTVMPPHWHAVKPA